MHGNDELRQPQVAFLLSICKVPYASEHIVGQPGSLEYLLRGFTCTFGVSNECWCSQLGESHTR